MLLVPEAVKCLILEVETTDREAEEPRAALTSQELCKPEINTIKVLPKMPLELQKVPKVLIPNKDQELISSKYIIATT
jgi:hypothetical protein